MLTGRLPDPDPDHAALPDAKAAAVAGGGVGIDACSTRRVWVGRLACFALGAAATAVGVLGESSLAARDVDEATRGPLRDGEGSPVPPRWVEELLTEPAAVIVPKAGRYERLSRTDLAQTGLAAGFERLLRIAVASDLEERVVASQCAVRTLAKLAQWPTLEAWRTDLPRDAVWDETRRLLDTLLRRAGRSPR